jgi:hypothetical protein
MNFCKKKTQQKAQNLEKLQIFNGKEKKNLKKL